MGIYIDGVQVPSKALQPHFTGNAPSYIEIFQSLYTGTGIHFLNEGLGINRYNYAAGYFLTAFDLTSDLSVHCNSHWNLVRSGSVRIEVGFETAPTVTINCIVYAEYDNPRENPCYVVTSGAVVRVKKIGIHALCIAHTFHFAFSLTHVRTHARLQRSESQWTS